MNQNNIGRLNTPGTRKVLCRPFGTPLTVEGYTWLPAAEVVAWLGFSWRAGYVKPGRTLIERLLAGALAALVFLGSEWAHNLAHAAGARAVGKPMDEIRILGGMPRVTYYELNDHSVSPRQHILRSLAGPVFNGLVWLLMRGLKRLPHQPGGLAAETLAVGENANVMISIGGLMPIPGLDGGAALKWGLIGAGKTVEQADQTVRHTNAGLSAALAVSSLFMLRKRKWMWGSMAGMLSLVALGIACGKIREK